MEWYWWVLIVIVLVAFAFIKMKFITAWMERRKAQAERQAALYEEDAEA